MHATTSPSRVYWRTREISRIASTPDLPFDYELAARANTIKKGKNTILYGEIRMDPSKLRIRGR